MAKRPTHIYSAQRPVRGQRSGSDPASLADGEFQTLTNGRFNRTDFRARDGCAKITSAVPVASASYRGHVSCLMNGTRYIVAAFRVSTRTRLYKIANPSLATWTWTEITAAAGAYGDTRFTTDGFVSFAVARDLTSLGKTDVLVCSNGQAEAVRIYNPDDASIFAPGADKVSPHDTVALPTDPRYFSRPIPRGWFNIRDSAITGYVASDAAKLTGADTGTDPLNEILVSIATAWGSATVPTLRIQLTTAAAATYDTTTSATAFRLNDSSHLWIIVEDAGIFPAFLQMAVEVHSASSGNYTTLWDANGTGFVDPVVIEMENGLTLWGFDTSIASAPSTDLIQIDEIRLSWKRDPGAARTFRIVAIMASGRVQGGSTHGMGYFYGSSRAHSVGKVCRSIPSYPISWAGASRNRTTIIPTSINLYYRYQVLYPDMNVTGVTYALFYRKDPGETEFLQLGSAGIQSLPGTPVAGTLNVKNDDALNEAKDPTWTMPDDQHRVIPRAKALASSGGRLFAAGISGSASEIWSSWRGNPFSFRPKDRFLYPGQVDPDSPTRDSIAGEDIQALAVVPGVYAGVASIVAFTDRGTWRYENISAQTLSRRSLVAPIGTYFPRTVAVVADVIGFLDTEKQVRSISGGVMGPPLSLYEVDDQLRDGVVSSAVAMAGYDRYSIAFAASGASVNRLVQNYDRIMQRWYGDSYSAQDWAGFGVHEDGSRRRVLGFSDEGHVYEVEKPGVLTDDGTGIVLTVKTREMHNEMWEAQLWGDVGMICDDAAGVTLAITHSFPQKAAGSDLASTIPIDVATRRAWRRSLDSDGAPPGAESPSCAITVSGTVPGGWRAQSIVVYTEPRGDRGADVDPAA